MPINRPPLADDIRAQMELARSNNESYAQVRQRIEAIYEEYRSLGIVLNEHEFKRALVVDRLP